MADTTVGAFTPQSDNLNAYVATTGVLVEAVRYGANKGVTLASATTYYFPLGGAGTGLVSGTALVSAHIKWAAALVATFTLEVTCFPPRENGAVIGPNDVTDYSAVVGEWVQFNPTTSYVPVVGTGNTVTAVTITAGGTNAGAAVIEMGMFASRRARIKCVVTTTGGLVRLGVAGKGG
jgi:hypothetical protein